MKITSKTAEVQASPQKVYDFLADFNNFKHLFPEDRVEQVVCTNDTCSFRIKGLAEINMKITDRSPSALIQIASYEKNPFPFTLMVHINGTEATSEVHMVFDGEVNAMMKMMIERPLTNFFNMLIEHLPKLDW